MPFEIIPIFLGELRRPMREILTGSDSEAITPTAYGCFALRDGKHTVMVDTGLPSQERMEREGLPFMRMQDAPAIENALADAGVDPLSVTHVVWTHLHYDHCSNAHLFPNARAFYVQKRELHEAVNPIETQKRIYWALPGMGKPDWTDAIGRIVLLDGDEEIIPGLSVALLPGHSTGSQGVIVETAKGSVLLAGDHITILESFKKRLPNNIMNSLSDWQDSCDKLEKMNLPILSGHGYDVFAKS